MNRKASNSSKNALRSLMKEKKLSNRHNNQRIQHSFSRYDSLGRLNCTICPPGTIIKSETLWAAHLTSKLHRLNQQNSSKTFSQPDIDMRSERATGSNQESNQGKDNDGTGKVDEDEESRSGLLQEDHRQKRVRFDGPGPSSPKNSLPSDFFDDQHQRESYENSRPTEITVDESDRSLDMEESQWNEFKTKLLAEETGSEPSKAQDPSNRERLFNGATSFSEAIYYTNGVADGIERQIDQKDGDPDEKLEEEEEEDLIERRIREEKEEIMDRIQKSVPSKPFSSFLIVF
ncbi:hypothetical protein PPACK8108_LOCUS13142 [Phakopsora pachyrhizi]|uniref:Coiled-coil domain-containing protein 16 n=1 Tax=Phakopsora pachyrhizi TaxID=170000 RepID=A0AAV0B2P6_PHAPC|nr:hypothetical protein PPACK8108_LOCUS13142 [Phakopsora pachyrhizi]